MEAREPGPGLEALPGSLDPRGRLWKLLTRDPACDLVRVWAVTMGLTDEAECLCFLIGRSHYDSGLLALVFRMIGPSTLQLVTCHSVQAYMIFFALYFLFV